MPTCACHTGQSKRYLKRHERAIYAGRSLPASSGGMAGEFRPRLMRACAERITWRIRPRRAGFISWRSRGRPSSGKITELRMATASTAPVVERQETPAKSSNGVTEHQRERQGGAHARFRRITRVLV